MPLPPIDLKGADILIVDDNPVNLKVLRQVLEEAGYNVLIATNGHSALKLATQAKPDAIMLDVRMPVMDGYAVCRRLKSDETTDAIPVLFITADDNADALVAGFAAGGVDYITKPFREEEVLMRLKTHLSLSHLTNELLDKNELLERENERKGRELVQARDLQIAMLPKEQPSFPQIDMGWHMTTASEVGGDYYDYSLTDDGTLTFILGDATGHGLQAGSVVFAIKIIFQNLDEGSTIVDSLQIMSRNLRDMNLQRFGMAMVMLKLKDNLLKISSAGIPGLLIYRNADQTIEEVEIPGMPLGYVAHFDYEERDVQLCSGDVVLLMSDGLIEQQNAAGEMLGFERPREYFLQVADQPPAIICQHMTEKGAEWAGDVPQGDDITFVVFRVR
jgi:serine phosphatase RsbU (regulator of sigma subunit)